MAQAKIVVPLFFQCFFQNSFAIKPNQDVKIHHFRFLDTICSDCFITILSENPHVE